MWTDAGKKDPTEHDPLPSSTYRSESLPSQFLAGSSKGCSYNISYFFCHVPSGAESFGLMRIWCFQDGNEVAKKKSFVTPPRFFSVDEARYLFVPFVT